MADGAPDADRTGARGKLIRWMKKSDVLWRQGRQENALDERQSARPGALQTVRSLLRGAVLALSIVAAVVITARYTDLIERFFIFFPERHLFQDPGDRGLDFEEVYFSAADGVRLHGWFVPGEGEKTLVWFHGNAGNIGSRVDHLAGFHSRLGVNVFIFDYRGYGRSDGSPSEKGTYLDADGALAHLRSRGDVDPQKLVLYGKSVGSAVAVEAATRNEAYALILETPFTSIQAMAKRHYPFLPGVGALVRTKYDSLSKMKDIHSPVMVVHGDRDEIAQFDMGRELFQAANPPKRFHTVEGAGHNDTYLVGGATYFDALASFLADPRADGR